MAALAGTTDTYSLKGNAEDFHDAIYDISPTECPVMTAAKLDAARKLLAANTPPREVASSIGVSLATLYRHIPGCGKMEIASGGLPGEETSQPLP